MMDENLNKYRTADEKVEHDKAKLILVYISSIVVLTSNGIFQIKDSLIGSFEQEEVLYVYWCVWLLLLALLIFQHFKRLPNLVRVVHFILIIRQIVPLFDIGKRKGFDDKAQMI